MPKKSSQSKGFTLIELIVTTTIIALIATYGFSSYRRTQQKQSLRAAGEKIEQRLIEIQKQVDIGSKECTGKLEGYRVTMENSSNQIQTVEVCETNTNTLSPTTISEATFTSPTTIIFFNTLTKGLKIEQPTGSDQATITFTTEGYNAEGSLTVNEPGVIEYQGT